MIRVLVGDDSFAINEHIKKVTSLFAGEPEYVDGEELTLNDIPSLVSGMTLFQSERLIIIRDASKNATVFGALVKQGLETSGDTQIILVEPSIDKRTTIYKDLKKHADIQEYKSWGERDGVHAEKWLIERAKTEQVAITPIIARYIVQRVGTGKWQLARAIEAIVLSAEPVTERLIDRILVPSVSENVFALFEQALRYKNEDLHRTIQELRLTEDAHAVFGLIVSQAMQLLALSRAEIQNDPIKDFGIHPFVASKMKQHASRRAGDVESIVRRIARADGELKTTAVDPWVVVEKTLLYIAEK